MSNSRRKKLFLFVILIIMGKIINILCLVFFAISLLQSCSTDVDLYADYKDIPIVYGIIDADLDTNYVKIVRAFSGTNDHHINAVEVALIADSNNYPGKLDAKIIELMKNSYGDYTPTGRVFQLDTMTIHDKKPGLFYAPDQKLYYTTEHFNKDDVDHNRKYRYRLQIFKESDTVSAETGLVGGGNFRLLTLKVNFSETFHSEGKVKFTPVNNGYLYDINMHFQYKEQKPGQPMTNEEMTWSLGCFGLDEMEQESEGIYSVSYSGDAFYHLLGRKIGADTLNVDRLIGKCFISIAAGGQDFYSYYLMNEHASSINQSVPGYALLNNIDGGYGLFSSRNRVIGEVGISARTIYELITHPGWGFRQDIKTEQE